MLQDFKGFEDLVFLVGDTELLGGMRACVARPPFANESILFLDTLSRRLLGRREARAYSDVVAFAFWCRKGSTREMMAAYPDLGDRLGRGVAFHVAPSNVPVNFAFSLAMGLLTGNANVVRLPSTDFPQVALICDAVKDALCEMPEMAPDVCLLRYGHQPDINDTLSALCDTRVIWGGDRTIETFRRSPLHSRAIDITFADRYSICLIDADRYLEMPGRESIAGNFFTDTLLTDQNACSSPRIVVWLGRETTRARAAFWGAFEAEARSRYRLQPAIAVEKLASLCRLAVAVDGTRMVSGCGNLASRVEVPALSGGIDAYFGYGGFFLEYRAVAIDEILPLCGRRCQTLSVLGVGQAAIDEFLMRYRPAGIDRVVPMGRTMDFGLRWDGYDLPYVMTRCRSMQPFAPIR